MGKDLFNQPPTKEQQATEDASFANDDRKLDFLMQEGDYPPDGISLRQSIAERKRHKILDEKLIDAVKPIMEQISHRRIEK